MVVFKTRKVVFNCVTHTYLNFKSRILLEQNNVYLYSLFYISLTDVNTPRELRSQL